jgi:hypothetical protein
MEHEFRPGIITPDHGLRVSSRDSPRGLRHLVLGVRQDGLGGIVQGVRSPSEKAYVCELVSLRPDMWGR